MKTVTYRAPELLRWFETGSQEAYKSALRKGRALPATQSGHWQKGVAKAASAALDLGKGAVADIVHRTAEQTVYKFYEDKFTIAGGMSLLTVHYRDVSSVRARGKDRFTVSHPAGTISIKPIAYLLSGRIKVPIGWERNGVEVPFTMLVEELSARCGLEIDSE